MNGFFLLLFHHMKKSDAIELLRPGLTAQGPIQVWADLGSGNGTFTKALAHLLNNGSIIYAVDTLIASLNEIPGLFNGCRIDKIEADFVKDELPLANLDGILMANSLHFVNDKPSLIAKISGYMKHRHHLLIVEYDTDTANRWVPFPQGFDALKNLFLASQYHMVEKLNEHPSVYANGNMYSAIISKN